MAMTKSAYAQGQQAFREGQPVTANPHRKPATSWTGPTNTPWHRWNTGHVDAFFEAAASRLASEKTKKPR
jgi:hypothetical protein